MNRRVCTAPHDFSRWACNRFLKFRAPVGLISAHDNSWPSGCIAAARRRNNKSAKIRETFEKLGAGARPGDVIPELAKRRIKVTSPPVSAVKAKLGNGASNGHKNGDEQISIASLVSAKEFTEQLGGPEKAQSALSALAKLR